MPQGPEDEMMAAVAMSLCELDRQNKEQGVQRPAAKKASKARADPQMLSATMSIVITYSLSILFSLSVHPISWEKDWG